MFSNNENPTTYNHLLNTPVILLVLVASLDYADKQLLSSSFPLLSHTLDLNIQTLGIISFFSDASYALSVPFWGYLVHQLGIENVFILLSISCASWGAATIGIALFGSSMFGQIFMRSVNGWMLGSILPLSQTLLTELVPNEVRGRAFGILSVSEKLAEVGATASTVYFDQDWKDPYYLLGLTSIYIGWLVYRFLDPKKIKYIKDDEKDRIRLTFREIVLRIARMPAFMCLVAQGVFGGTPWSMMSFQLLLLDWRGFTKDQILTIQLTSGISATIGGWIGGVLGDYAASVNYTKGRIMIALISVLGGIPAYGMFLYSTNYYSALIYINLFHIVASWTPSAAIRPICSELTRNPSERAQIVSMWLVLEKLSAAIFGAPLVGLLVNKVIMSKNQDANLSNEHKAWALANQLLFLCSLFWSICALFWMLMARSINVKARVKIKNTTEIV